MDMDAVLNRLFVMLLIALVPSLLIDAVANLWLPVMSAQSEAFTFLVSLAISISLLYSFEHTKARFDQLVFPRKYQLQSALHGIVQSLHSATLPQELKGLILAPAVRVLQASGAAIVFRYPAKVEHLSKAA